MGRLKFIGLAVMALVVAALGLTATASAETNLPWILPETVTKIDATSGVTELQQLGGTSVLCKKDTAETLNLRRDPAEGEFHITFSECEAAGKPCTGTNEAAGVILVLGDFKIVHDITHEGTTYAILFEVLPTTGITFLCTILGADVKITVKGSVQCLILEPTSLKELHEIHCKNNGTFGDPQEVKWWFEGRTGEASLLSSLNGGTFTTSAESGLATLKCLNASGVGVACEIMG
jgi:hypothetical protein